MAVTINASSGLAAGGNVYIKQLDTNGNWVNRGTVKDGSKSAAAGNLDNDPKPASVTYGGGANLTTYVQVDNDGRAGDTDVFWRVVQDARGNVVSRVKQAPLSVTGAQGMKPGARIDIYSGDGKKLLNSTTDQSGKDLDRSGNVKFSTFATKGADYRVNITNKGAPTIQLGYENLGEPGGGKYVLPPLTWINDVRNKGDLLTRFFNANGGNQARMIAEIKKNGSNPQTTAYGAVAAAKALTAARGGNVKLTNGSVVSWATALTNAGNAATNWGKNASAFINVYSASKAATAQPVVPQITKNAILSAYTEFKAVARSLSVSQPIGLPADLGIGPVAKYNAQAIGTAANQAATVMNSFSTFMDKVTKWPGTVGQLNEALGDPNWAKTVETRLNEFSANTKTAVKNYYNEIAGSMDVTRKQQEKDRAYAIFNLAASLLWFVGGAMGAVSAVSSFASSTGTLNNLTSGLGSFSAATGSTVSVAREATTKVNELKNTQTFSVSGAAGSAAVKALSQDMKELFWDVEAKVGKKLGFYELSQAGFGNFNGTFADRKIIESGFKNAGGPGWNATYGLYLTVTDQKYLGFADNFNLSINQGDGDSSRTNVRDSVKRWLVPYGI